MKRIIIIIISLAVVLSFSNAVFAESPEEVDEKEQEFQDKCDTVEIRIKRKVERFNEKKNNHVKRYDAVESKLGKLIKKLNEKEYDTAKLEADLKVFEDKAEEFKDDYAVFVGKLEKLKNACDYSRDDFYDEKDEIEDLLKEVRDDIKDIQSFYKDTIKSHIRDIEDQKKD